MQEERGRQERVEEIVEHYRNDPIQGIIVDRRQSYIQLHVISLKRSFDTIDIPTLQAIHRAGLLPEAVITHLQRQRILS
jgi:hypothetical protein